MHWLSNVSVRRPIFATVLVALVVVFGHGSSGDLGGRVLAGGALAQRGIRRGEFPPHGAARTKPSELA